MTPELEAAVQELRAAAPSTGSGVMREPARLVAPLSGSVAGAARPIFRWTGSGVGVIQACADRQCARTLSAFLGVSGSARPPRALPPGVVFWRLLTLGPRLSIQTTPAWELFVRTGAANAPAATRGLRYDADADGFIDAAVREHNETVNNIHVFSGGVDGIQASRDTVVALDPAHGSGFSAAGDVNGDGFGDLAVAHAGSVVVYAGSAAGLVTEPLSTIPRPGDVVDHMFGTQVSGAGDVNGDGFGDVVIAAGDRLVWVHTGGPTGVSATPAWVTDRRNVQNRYVRLMTVGDLNGDGFGDLVLTDYGSGDAVTGFRYLRGGPTGLEAPETGTFVARPTLPTGTSGDIDGDGVSDLVSIEGSSLAIFRGGAGFPGGEPTQTLSTGDAGGVRIFAGPAQVGDFNGDGAFDLAVRKSTETDSFYFTDDWIDIYLGGATGVQTAPAQTVTETSVLPDNQLIFGFILGNGDFNRDGRDDLLAATPPPYPTPFFETSPSAVFVFPGAAEGISVTPALRLDGQPGFGNGATAGVPQFGH